MLLYRKLMWIARLRFFVFLGHPCGTARMSSRLMASSWEAAFSGNSARTRRGTTAESGVCIGTSLFDCGEGLPQRFRHTLPLSMAYRSLADAVSDLGRNRMLVQVSDEVGERGSMANNLHLLWSSARRANDRGMVPVTAAGSRAKARGPAYPVCPHWDWRGNAAPPFEPPASRAAAGSNGRTGAPPPNPRTGALLAQRRTVVVPARLTRAERADWLAVVAGP